MENEGMYKATVWNFGGLCFCLLFVLQFGLSASKRTAIGIDEYISLSHIQTVTLAEPFPVEKTLHSVATRSASHVPLYFIALNLWQKLVGSDLVSLRLLSVYFAILAVAVTYRLNAEAAGCRQGLAAAFFLSFLAFFLFYAHNIRMYTLVALLSACVIFFNWRAVHASAPRAVSNWLALFVAAVLAIYTHQSSVILLAALCLTNLLLTRASARSLKGTGVIALAGLTLIPYTLRIFDTFLQNDELTQAPLHAMEVISTVAQIYSNNLPLIPLGIALFFLLARARLKAFGKYVLLVAAVSFLAMLLLNEFIAIFLDTGRMRYTSVLFVPIASLAAIGMSPASAWPRRLAALTWMALLAMYTGSSTLLVNTPYGSRGPLRPHHLQSFLQEEQSLPAAPELLLNYHPESRITQSQKDYYRPALRKRGWGHLVHIWLDDGSLQLDSFGNFASLQGIAAHRNSLWLITNPSMTNLQHVNVFTEWLAGNFQRCQTFVQQEALMVAYYLKRGFPCELVSPPHTHVAIDYDNGLALGNIILSVENDAVIAYLRWEKMLQERFSYSLQLFDESGDKVQQVDQVIAGDPVKRHTLDLSTLAPGSYRASLVIYHFETLESVAGTGPDGLRSERDFSVASLAITRQ